jgi:hypothetical protein
VTRVAVLRDPTISAGLGLWAAIQSVLPAFAIEVTQSTLGDAGEIERLQVTPARAIFFFVFENRPHRLAKWTHGSIIARNQESESLGSVCLASNGWK